MRARALGVLLGVLATAGPAWAQETGSEPASQNNRFLEIPKATLKHPARTTPVRKQQVDVGKRADGTPLMIDLTLPKDVPSGRLLPLAILIHGGLPDSIPIRPRQWQVYQDWGPVIAAAGAATIMFDHTLGSPKARLDQALAELDVVLRWVVERGSSAGVDPRRITVTTFSAGALLVPAMLASARPVELRSIVMMYPLVGVGAANPAAATMDEALLARLSLRAAAADIAARGTSLFIVRAGKDEIPELLPVLDTAIAALLAANAAVEVLNLPGMPHSFDMFANAPQSRDAIQRVARRIAER